MINDMTYRIMLETSIVAFTIAVLKMHYIDQSSLLAQPLSKILLRDGA